MPAVVVSLPSCCPTELRDKSSLGERGLGAQAFPRNHASVPGWRKAPEGYDNPFIFKRSGRKSQVTLCRNSSELHSGVCGSSCQQGQPVSVTQVSSSHDGREGTRPEGACAARPEPLAMMTTMVIRAEARNQEVWTGAGNSEPPVDLPSYSTLWPRFPHQENGDQIPFKEFNIQHACRGIWHFLSSVTMGYLCITSDAKQKCKLGKMCQARLSYCPQTVPQVRTRSCSHMHFRPTTCQPAGLSPAVAALAPYSLVQELTKGSLGTWSVQVASGGF